MSNGGRERTYSIWGVAGLFLALGVVGLFALLFGGSPVSETTQVAGPQTPNTVLDTEPALAGGSVEGAADASAETVESGQAAGQAGGSAAGESSATTEVSPTGVEASAPVTVPGGAPAPEGVREVLSARGSISFTFDVPAALATPDAIPAVAPTRIRVSEDGTSITAVISCATSSTESLAQLSVSESDLSVSIVAVVLVPPGGPPCDPATPAREVTVPLSMPLGERTIVVVPAGTAIPQAATT